MIAVGALHESLTASSAADIWAAGLKQHFSVQQYNKAIQCLTNSTVSPPPIEVVLTSCIIFIGFENLYGRNGEALKHLRSGITMLKMWSPKTSSELMLREEYLIPVFTRGYSQHAFVSMPLEFNNLESARKHLQILLDEIYSSVDAAVLSEESREVDAKVLCAKSSLQGWYTKFTKLRVSRDKEEGRSRILLRLQFETALILLAAVQLNDESGFDEHIGSFQVIISQCEQLVALESSLTGRDTTKSEAFTYGFDLNILPPLNITAFKCRDPGLRRKAIALLKAGNRYEGLWNGKTVARIAQKTLEIEEAGLVNVVACTDIPRKHRVRLVALSYNPGCPTSASR